MKTILLLLSILIITRLNAQYVSEVWQVQYGTLIGAYDIAEKVVADNDGNIYVTGTTGNPNNTVGGDITTIKYNSAGDQLWVAVYDGVAKGWDAAADIVLDENASVYVAGYTYNSNGNPDFVTIKYNSDGQEQWTNVYDDPFSGWDYAQAITIDGNGNTFVTGVGVNSNDSLSTVTVKYNAAGQQQWVATYNCGYNGMFLSGIGSDAAGNIYIAGSMEYAPAIYQFFTIKYNTSGQQQWISAYQNGTLHAFAVDTSGNSYVSGMVSPGSICTIKYNSSGGEDWVTFFDNSGTSSDFSNAITVDDEGNVYITGSSNSATNHQMLTVKYNSNGAQQWKQLNGTGNYTSAAHDVKSDKSGNVYVTGLCYNTFNGTGDFTTIKYDSGGTQQWLSTYNGTGNGDDQANALSLDGNGNVFVTGWVTSSDARKDYGTVKYSSNGNYEWGSIYNYHISGSNQAKDIAIDNNGNIFVTGQGADSLAAKNFTTVKYNNYGAQQWVAIYQDAGTSTGTDGAHAICTDQSGNVYVTGQLTNSSGNTDCATIKYSTYGYKEWAKTYNGNGNGNDRANDIAVDISGNVYVTGYSTNSSSLGEFVTIKYNSNGSLLWSKFYDEPFYGGFEATYIALDADANVYVTGWTNGTGKGYTTIKYNNNGIQQWASFYETGSSDNFEKSYLALDDIGNVYVTGSSFNLNGSYDYVTVKYNSSGAQQWAETYNGTGNSHDIPSALVIDAGGNVYVTGKSAGNLSEYDFMTIKYSTSGALLWTAPYNASGTSVDIARDIAIDDTGNVYVAGFTSNDNGFNAYGTIKYNNEGVQQWIVKTENGYSSSPAKLTLDNSNNVYITGYTQVENGYDFLTVKLTQSITGIDNHDLSFSIKVLPNLTADQVNLQFTKPFSGSVTIINVIGERMLEKKIFSSISFQIDVKNFPAGVYFISITDENKNVVKKKFVKM